MRALVRSFLMVAFAFALGSCQPPKIELLLSTVGGLQVVSLSQDWGLIVSRKKAPCVDRIDLNASSGKRPLVWRVEAKGAQCVHLDHFVIGEVPARFIESVPLATTPSGWFDFLVTGTGTGQAQFELR
jgi:hypothetical protein